MQTFSAADCLPRLSPPTASPASIAPINRSARSPWAMANPSRVACTTCGPASMLPATEIFTPRTIPAQLTQFSPVCWAIYPCASRIWHCRWSKPGSPRSRSSRTACGASPARKRGQAGGKCIGLTSAWVAMAATPPSTWMQIAPTAKKREATAAPRAPVAGSRTRMDHVMPAVSCGPGRNASLHWRLAHRKMTS